MPIPASKISRVLVLNDPRFFEQFHQNLASTLTQLGCEPIVFTRQAEAERRLKEGLPPCDLVLLDPSVENFDARAIMGHIRGPDAGRQPNVMTIVYHPEEEFGEAEGVLDPAGKIVKHYDPQDLTFIFNRFLFPEQHNRRKNPRVLAAIRTEHCLGRTGRPLPGLSFNVSAGGLFVRCYDPQPAGITVRLVLNVPDGKAPIECEGLVVYSKEYVLGETGLYPSGMGVEFRQIRDEDRGRVVRFVEPYVFRADRKRGGEVSRE